MRAWEEAYRAYASVNEAVARSRSVDADTAGAMAVASSAVASSWRALAASAREQPWWVLAAVGSAAQAFEEQARHWENVHRKESTEQTAVRSLQPDMDGRLRSDHTEGFGRPSSGGDLPPGRGRQLD